jgi:hypothetical protein
MALGDGASASIMSRPANQSSGLKARRASSDEASTLASVVQNVRDRIAPKM